MASIRVASDGISPSGSYGSRNHIRHGAAPLGRGHSMRPRLGMRPSPAFRRPQDGAAPHMIPDRSCIWCLSNIPTRPMARRACRPAIGRLRSPSTSDCVTLGPLGIPHHDMRSPFAADPDARGSCRRPQARRPLPHAHLRTSARILPHLLEWWNRSQSLEVSTIHDFLRVRMHNQHTMRLGIHTSMPRGIRVRRGPAGRPFIR